MFIARPETPDDPGHIYIYIYVFIFNSLGHFDYFGMFFRFDHESRIYMLLSLTVRFLIPKPDHIRFIIRTYIYVCRPVYEKFDNRTWKRIYTLHYFLN